MSELVARLHAAEIAAEVGALHPTPPSLANSKSSSEKSAVGSVTNKVEATTAQPKPGVDAATSMQDDPCQSSISDCQTMVSGVSTQEMPPLSSSLQNINQQDLTKAATETNAAEVQIDASKTTASVEASAPSVPSIQPASTPKSHFQENIPDGAKSMPAFPTMPNAIRTYNMGLSATNAMCADAAPPSSPTAGLTEPAKHTHQKSKPRRMRWSPISRVHQGWMALRKKPTPDDLGQ